MVGVSGYQFDNIPPHLCGDQSDYLTESFIVLTVAFASERILRSGHLPYGRAGRRAGSVLRFYERIS